MRPRKDPNGQPNPALKAAMSKEMVRHLKWSNAEKQIAGGAFELALDREFRNVIRRAKDMAGKIEQPTDLSDLEHSQVEAWQSSELTDVTAVIPTSTPGGSSILRWWRVF